MIVEMIESQKQEDSARQDEVDLDGPKDAPNAR